MIDVCVSVYKEELKGSSFRSCNGIDFRVGSDGRTRTDKPLGTRF